MKNNKYMVFMLAAIGFGMADFAQAQEFGAVRPAVAPVIQTSNRLESQVPAPGETRQDPEKIQAPQRPDQEPLPELAQEDETPQRERVTFGPWPAKKIDDISIDIREKGDVVPEDRSAQLLGFNPKQWTQFNPSPKVFAWAAPDIRYQPLFFEDVALERYGQTLPPYRQTVLSAVRMTNSFFLFPNHARHDPIFSCDYPLGFCRPGNTVDYTLQRQYLGHHPKR